MITSGLCRPGTAAVGGRRTGRRWPASAALTRVLATALDLATGMKDEYVATDHLLVAITVEELNGSVASALVREGHASWA